MNGAVANLHLRPRGMLPSVELPLRRQAHISFRHDGFESLYRLFIRSTTYITGSVVVIVREKTGCFAIPEDAGSPVPLVSLMVMVSLSSDKRRLLVPQSEELLNVLLVECLIFLLRLFEFALD